jgi:hypothetical protein
MRKQIAQMAAAVAVAALAGACGGGGDAGAKGRMAGGRERGTPERVKLDGCVQAAPGNRQYVLQDVVLPGPPEQPVGNEALSQGPNIPQGSWVRLKRGGDDLEQYLGKRVEVEGLISDSGRTTMGTAGNGDDQSKLRRASPDASSTTDRSLPPSTVPPYGASANGLAPEVTVERIKTVADTCATEKEQAAEGNTGLGKRRRAPKEDNPGPGSHR